MKRLMLAIVTVALGGLTTVALAGDYHVGTTLICSDCHVMHGQQSHANADTTNSVANMYVNFQGGPFPFLLRGETVSNACLNCHNGRTDVPDVLGDSPNPPANGRRAGALAVDPSSPHGLSNSDGYETGDGHTHPPDVLRKQVTSKGGTTEAALNVFSEERLAERFARALAAATRRGGELGDELGKD
jgi:hypothetical protein